MTSYLVFKSLHIISVISWMAGMLYLPRLYAYHAGVDPKSEASQIFKTMERRLLRIIVNPAMILTFIFGAVLVVQADAMSQGWFHGKLTLVLVLAGVHGWLAKMRKTFERDENTRSPKFYKILNEVPAVLMIFIVFLAVLKPF